MGLFKTLCWTLIFLTRLRFPPGPSIAANLPVYYKYFYICLYFVRDQWFYLTNF